MCRTWIQTGHCSYEALCCFAHGDKDLRIVEQNVKVLSSLGYLGDRVAQPLDLTKSIGSHVALNSKTKEKGRRGGKKDNRETQIEASLAHLAQVAQLIPEGPIHPKRQSKAAKQRSSQRTGQPMPGKRGKRPDQLLLSAPEFAQPLSAPSSPTVHDPYSIPSSPAVPPPTPTSHPSRRDMSPEPIFDVAAGCYVMRAPQCPPSIRGQEQFSSPDQDPQAYTMPVRVIVPSLTAPTPASISPSSYRGAPRQFDVEPLWKHPPPPHFHWTLSCDPHMGLPITVLNPSFAMAPSHRFSPRSF